MRLLNGEESLEWKREQRFVSRKEILFVEETRKRSRNRRKKKGKEEKYKCHTTVSTMLATLVIEIFARNHPTSAKTFYV